MAPHCAMANTRLHGATTLTERGHPASPGQVLRTVRT
jgi:hypothetical protein